MAWFHLPVMVLFGTQFLGLSFAETGALIWIRWCACVLFDFVGGVTADRFGRKAVFIIGVTLELTCFLSYTVVANYALLIILSLLGGFGRGLQGNSLDALLYDQANRLKAKKQYVKAVATSQMFGYTGRAAASLLGGFAYAASPILPFLLTSLALSVALICGILTKFPSSHVVVRATRITSLKMIKATLRLYRRNAVLRRYLIAAGMMEIGAEALFNYCQPFYIHVATAPELIGLIMAGVALTSGVSSLLIRKLSRLYSAQSILVLIVTLSIPTIIGMLVLPPPYVFFAPVFMAIGFGLAMPNMRLLVNKHAPSDVRASVLSLATTATLLAYVVGMWFLYTLVDHVTPVVVLLGIGCVVGCALVVSIWEWSTSVRRPRSFYRKRVPAVVPVQETD